MVKKRFYVYRDADYANSDRDELIKVVESKDEAHKFIDEWSSKQALGIANEEFSGFSSIKNAFKTQLFVTDHPGYK